MVFVVLLGVAAAGIAVKIVLSRKGGPSAEPDHPRSSSKTVNRLWRLYAELWDLQVQLDPITATMLGEYACNDRVADLSMGARKAAVGKLRHLAERVGKLNEKEVPEHEQQNYLFLKEMLRMEIAARETFEVYELPTNHLMGPHLIITQAANFHPWRTANDAETYIARLRAFKRQSKQIIDGFGYGIRESKKLLPGESVMAMVKQCEAQWVFHAEDSPIFKIAQPLVSSVGGSVPELRQAVRDCVIPSFRSLAHFLKDEYLPKARKVAGVCAFKDGPAFYKGCIEYFTSTRMTAEELHELGKEEVERISSKIREVRKELPYPDLSLAEFVKKLEADPSYYATDGEDIINRYYDILRQAQKRVPALFSRMPSASIEVKAIEPFREASAPPAHYYPAPDDRSRGAVFYANTCKPTTRPLYVMNAISLHEGVPGHHLQISLAQEIRNLPRVRRQVQSFCIGYAEGWGLYAEYLGEVLGFYSEPIDYFGRLMTEVWRACRLVVDTGLHSYGWTREEAVVYLRENAALSEVDLQSEVDRYMVFPGQALAYKVGELRILKAKEEAERALGDRFSWKGFHSAILKSGAVPLTVMEQNVAGWVSRRR